MVERGTGSIGGDTSQAHCGGVVVGGEPGRLFSGLVGIMGTGCWEWGKCVDGDGYAVSGKVMWGTKIIARQVYTYLMGDDLKGKRLYRTCKNGRCVNPMHMRATVLGSIVRKGY